MIRLILYASMTFLTAFAGVTWASHGFPMQISRPDIVAPLQPRVTATFGDQSARDHERKMWEAEHTAQSDKDPRLDSIRLDGEGRVEYHYVIIDYACCVRGGTSNIADCRAPRTATSGATRRRPAP